ncbi:MAG: carboxypeptidase regulatory-like domain-containing protein [Bacteroidales bacterium]|nr:carboxypeptidase regulatory-like domain-containing protein [Bacteroidales bacterium]
MKRTFTFYIMVIALVITSGKIFSQSIFYGVSNTFTIGTQQYEPSPIITGYSAVFDMNTMGEYITGYSNLFVLNTMGLINPWASITGTVTNANTGLSIPNAHLYIYPNSLSINTYSATSTGTFNISLPFGYGYSLTFYANGYYSQTVSGIHLTANNPSQILNIELVPHSASFNIANVLPNPNPTVSEVIEGGTLHRYYLVKEPNTNLTGAGAYVTVSVNSYDKIFTANADGLVDIEIESSEIGNGQAGASASFSITDINNTVLSNPVGFACEVVDSEYEKTWDNSTFGKLGISIVEVEFERGSSVSLIERNSTSFDAEDIFIIRQGRNYAGVEFSASAEAKVELGPVSAGAGASAGVGGGIAGVTEDYYTFPHTNYDGWQAVSQYILFADGNFNSIDNTLIRLLTKCQEWFTNQSSMQNAFLGDKKGLDVKVNAQAQANAGINATQNLQIGVQASVGTEGHVTLSITHHETSQENEYSFGMSGTLAGSAGAGIYFDFDDDETNQSSDDAGLKELSTELDLLNYEGTRGFEVSVFLDAQTFSITRAQLRFLHRRFFAGIESEVVYELPGTAIQQAISGLTADFQNLRNINQSSGNFLISKNSANEIARSLFTALYNLQVSQTGNTNITYQKEKANIEQSLGFNIEIKGALTSGLKAEVGGGTGFEQRKSMVIETGKWAMGKHYPNWKYTGEIPAINKTYQEVVQDITDNVPLVVRIAMGTIDFFTNPFGLFKSDSIFYVGDMDSYIVFDQNSWPTNIDTLHCTSWSWYGDAPSKTKGSVGKGPQKIFEQNKSMAIESFGMVYGVGGFYQFEPYDTILPDTAWFTILYPDSDVVDMDETTLALYYENKENHQWVYVGGIVDTANNSLTAPINRLALYTLAPAMPFGSFGLNANPDTLFADSISISTITSDTIRNNDFSIISNGQLFTVKTNHGHITNADADTSLEGIQIESLNGIIQFELKSSYIAGRAIVTARSEIGSASARDTVVFIDTIAPVAPLNLTAIADNSKVNLTWSSVDEDDLGGYIVYFDTDSTLPPYEGISTVWGKPSPIIVGVDTMYTVQGLFNDTLYYFTIKAYDISGNESDYSSVVDATPFHDTSSFDQQEIHLSAGWGIFSSFIIPVIPSIDSVISSIVSNVAIVKNGDGQVYWPAFGVNLIGNMSIGQGYQIKTNNIDTLVISGMAVEPENISNLVPAAWSLIGYLRNSPGYLPDMLSSLSGNIQIVKDQDGQVYWPVFGVNLIGDMQPGQGYQIKMSIADTLIYPANSPSMLKPFYQSASPNYFKNPLNTGNNMTLGIPRSSWQQIPQPGDEVGVFGESGLLVGTGVFDGGNMAITIWGDDETTPEIDGLQPGESFSLQTYRNLSGLKKNLTGLEFTQGDNTYQYNKIAIVGLLKTIAHDEAILFQNTPNPFTHETEFGFYLPEKTRVEFSIINLLGEVVEVLVSGEMEAGKHSLKYQTKQLPAGSYYYRLETSGYNCTKKMMIMR